MTIKHLGGVFGRNPTFNDVTIEGQLTFEGNIDVDSDITWDDNKKALFGDNADLAIYSDGTQSFITESGPGRLYIGGTHLSITNASGTKNYFQGIDGGAATLYNSGSAKLSTSSTGISVTGNVAVNAGYGIDFSATSGTGTSELFDDYEEGAVTNPLYVGGTQITSGYSVNGATYTKVGDTVIMNIYIDYTSPSGSGPSGNVTIGLPFTPTNSAILGTSIYMSVSAASYAGAFFSVASGVGTVALTEANVNNAYSLAQGERIIVRAAIAYRAS